LAIETLRSGGAEEEELVVRTVDCVGVIVASKGDTLPASGSPCIVDMSSAGDVERGEMGTSDCGAPAAVDG
jgi:hypothetical protein